MDRPPRRARLHGTRNAAVDELNKAVKIYNDQADAARPQ